MTHRLNHSLLLCSIVLCAVSMLPTCFGIDTNTEDVDVDPAGEWCIFSTQMAESLIVGGTLIFDSLYARESETDTHSIWIFTPDSLYFYRNYDVTAQARDCYTILGYTCSIDGDRIVSDRFPDEPTDLAGGAKYRVYGTVERIADTLIVSIAHVTTSADTVSKQIEIAYFSPYSGPMPPAQWFESQCQ